MTYHDDFTLPMSLLEQLTASGMDALLDLFRVLLNASVLIAIGVDVAGKRSVLGVSVALSEQETHWRQFLRSLVRRGLCGVRLIVSDAHEGLMAAWITVFGSAIWQRCQFHLQ